MDTNREVKIAIIVGIIMVTGCILAFIFVKNKNNPTLDLDLHVYKHIANDDGTGMYYECSIPTDSLVKINNEFKRIMNIRDNEKINDLSISIEGNYKIISGSNFIAFDNDEKEYVYRSDSTAIYKYPTELYEQVDKYCSYITKESVEAATKENEEQTETKEEKETKKDTKSNTSDKNTSTKKTTKK